MNIIERIFKVITDFIKSLSKSDIIYIGIIVLLIYFLFNTIKSKNRIEDRLNHNIECLTDTIKYFESENGNLVATKLAFESDVKDLKKLNEELYKEIEDLELKKSVEHIVYVEGETVFLPQDTIYIVDNIGEGFYKDFNFNDDWRTLEGNIKYNNDSLKLDITNNSVKFDYTLAMDDDNRIYVKSSNPYVKYNEITGFTVPKPKKTHFAIGPSVGFGYGIINNKPDIFIGVNATWTLFKF